MNIFAVNGALIANGDESGTINVIQNYAVVTPDLGENDLGRRVMLAKSAVLEPIDRDHAMGRLQMTAPTVQIDHEDRIVDHLADAAVIAQAQGDLRGV